MAEPERRRRRLRGSSTPAVAQPADDSGTTGPESTGPGTTGPETPARRGMPGPFPRPSSPGDGPGSPAGEERAAPRAPERGMESLRGLVGSGSSQVSVGAAMRARDAARPTDEQLADAEQNLAVVRRNWTPREELPRGR
jgi:hypothetical protein